MSFDVSTLQQQIPYYLTENQKYNLIENLKSLGAGSHPNIYLSEYNDSLGDDLHQGDGMRGFEVFLWENSETKSARGIVLSNSCDLSASNVRDVPSRIVFAPLVKLENYKQILQRGGVDADKMDYKIESIKQQKTTNIFYLPSGGPMADEYIVRLDDVHSIPMARHLDNPKRERLFRLNMNGFYLFVLKLSLHFCRLQENVSR